MFEQPEKKIKINCSQDVYSCMTPYLYDEPVEHFYILLLDRNHQVLKIHKISSGGTNATLADPKLIFKKALDHLASGIVLVHNHPSGNLKPSDQDRTLTRKLSEAGKYLEVSVLDHVIFANVGYFSFADEGLM
jgi:DNA repair protein RadC